MKVALSFQQGYKTQPGTVIIELETLLDRLICRIRNKNLRKKGICERVDLMTVLNTTVTLADTKDQVK